MLYPARDGAVVSWFENPTNLAMIRRVTGFQTHVDYPIGILVSGPSGDQYGNYKRTNAKAARLNASSGSLLGNTDMSEGNKTQG